MKIYAKLKDIKEYIIEKMRELYDKLFTINEFVEI